jgi:hypothetical protein
VHEVTTVQVDQLAAVLKEKFRFKVFRVVLQPEEGRLVQTQLNRGLAKFVDDEDGQHTLLMVYYAGHAVPDKIPHQLILSG